MTNVIQLPVPAKVCSGCEHFMCGSTGMFCAYWREDIVFEDVAAECDAFERI